MGFFSNLKDKFSAITGGGKKSNKSTVELQYDKAMSLFENANGNEAIEILEGIDLDLNQDGSFTGSSKTKKIYETIACHSAVRSGEGLDETQVR